MDDLLHLARRSTLCSAPPHTPIGGWWWSSRGAPLAPRCSAPPLQVEQSLTVAPLRAASSDGLASILIDRRRTAAPTVVAAIGARTCCCRSVASRQATLGSTVAACGHGTSGDRGGDAAAGRNPWRGPQMVNGLKACLGTAERPRIGEGGETTGDCLRSSERRARDHAPRVDEAGRRGRVEVRRQLAGASVDLGEAGNGTGGTRQCRRADEDQPLGSGARAATWQGGQPGQTPLRLTRSSPT